MALGLTRDGPRAKSLLYRGIFFIPLRSPLPWINQGITANRPAPDWCHRPFCIQGEASPKAPTGQRRCRVERSRTLRFDCRPQKAKRPVLRQCRPVLARHLRRASPAFRHAPDRFGLSEACGPPRRSDPRERAEPAPSPSSCPLNPVQKVAQRRAFTGHLYRGGSLTERGSRPISAPQPVNIDGRAIFLTAGKRCPA